jgi:hypothetical protein
MPNILILGATGSLAREVIATAARNPALHLTLFARNPRNTRSSAATRSTPPRCKRRWPGRTSFT